jgi:hypothetical protein
MLKIVRTVGAIPMVVGLLLVSSPGVRAAQRADVKPTAVETFNSIDFTDPNCWKFDVSGGHIEYTNMCTSNANVEMVHADGSEATHVIAPKGKLIFLGGNTVHIIGQIEEIE